MKKEELIEEIRKLKEEKDALVLAHYYVDGDLQEIADFVGDSYGLSKEAMESDRERIVFCGVKFMGESAKLLNPHKKVYLVNKDALCPMADMVDGSIIEEERKKHDDLCVVTYINSTAETKKHADICITSSNAVKIIENLESDNIFLIPDKNLGYYIKENFKDKNIKLHDGYCYVHNEIDRQALESAMEKYPRAKVLVHPESNPEIFPLADFIGSTSGILKYAKESEEEDFIICTEKGILHQLRKDSPNKNFYFTERSQTCKDMKKLSLEDLRDVLKYDENEVLLEEELMEKARIPLLRMMEYSKL